MTSLEATQIFGMVQVRVSTSFSRRQLEATQIFGMVQVDVFWSYAIGAGLAPAAQTDP